MKVVILAGGFGTRLSEYTDSIPKPMVPIGDKPMIEHIMGIYANYGHKEFYVSLGYKGEVIKEYFKKKPASPYAETKLIGEKIIFDFSKKNKNFKSISLRYFNPIGAHDSLLIGELPIGQPQNLIPRITQSISNKIDNLYIYGNDYNTRDGTCVRDYIHVMDVAESHVYALKQLINSKDLIYDDFNVGTGEGKSVLEIINCFEKTNKLDINFSFSN